MARVCHFTGRRTSTGNKIRMKGKAKYLGGIGKNTTSITPRKFRPNLQNVRAMIDGAPARVQVSAKAIRQGLVVKPLKRKYAYTRLQKQDQS